MVKLVWTNPCAGGHQWRCVGDKKLPEGERFLKFKCGVCGKGGHAELSREQASGIQAYKIGDMIEWDGEKK
jgi:hypothetical protein